MTGAAPLVEPEDAQRLLELGRRALVAYFHLDREAPESEPVTSTATLGGLFATLERAGELRGCIGFLSPETNLDEVVKRAVVAAAVEDPRFPRVTADEVPELRIRLSLLTPPVPLESPADLQIGRDGLIVERGGARGLLLPRVASERGWDPERFLAETCRKAGLPPDAFRDPRTRVLRFESLELAEPETPA